MLTHATLNMQKMHIREQRPHLPVFNNGKNYHLYQYVVRRLPLSTSHRNVANAVAFAITQLTYNGRTLHSRDWPAALELVIQELHLAPTFADPLNYHHVESDPSVQLFSQDFLFST